MCLQIAYILVIFLTISLFSSVQLNGSDGGKKGNKKKSIFSRFKFLSTKFKGKEFCALTDGEMGPKVTYRPNLLWVS